MQFGTFPLFLHLFFILLDSELLLLLLVIDLHLFKLFGLFLHHFLFLQVDAAIIPLQLSFLFRLQLSLLLSFLLFVFIEDVIIVFCDLGKDALD